MILIPGHHSRRASTRNTLVNFGDAESSTPGAHLGDPATPVGQNERLGDSTTPLNPIQSEFDEYGAELGPEARVWKTYVKETDKFDTDQVEEWNKSLDVILIFAALFSAISSGFVLESSKRLKEDSGDTSSHTLTLISQTLLAIANNTRPAALTDPTPSQTFSPTRSDICVNVLWFLSLSLSVAVSLIAMLAKEWCHAFLAGRTGHPCAQARRRQQRWTGITKWRMPELLVLLPTLTHLALLLFAVGLSIYLWDLHSGVAVPVIVVTLCALGIYTAATILPFLYEHCPYSTTISRLARQFYDLFIHPKGPWEEDYIKQDKTTSEALGWLIESCEDPRSVDIALQAIAGADKDLPLEPLKNCDASTAVCRRLTAGSAYPKNYAIVFGLYARALAVLHPSATRSTNGELYDHVNELKRKIRVLQMAVERGVAHSLSTEAFRPTQNNLLALRIGSTAPALCLRSLNFVDQNILLDALKAGLDLLQIVDGTNRSRKRKVSLLSPGVFKVLDQGQIHPASRQSLVKGLSMLLSCSLIHSSISMVAPQAVRLLHIDEHREDCRLLLAVLAISRNDYPGWTLPAPLDPPARAERAVELLTHYELRLDPLPARALMALGLFELLVFSDDYSLTDKDYTRIYELLRIERWADGAQASYNAQFIHALPPLTHNATQTIHTFPVSFDLDQHHFNALAEKLSIPSQRDMILSSDASIEAHLGALCFICNPPLGSIPPDIYVFIIESVCKNPSDLVQSMATDLILRFSKPELTEDLASAIIDRNIVWLLLQALDSGSPSVEAFATTQIRLLMQLILRATDQLSGGARLLLSGLCQYEARCDPLKQLEVAMKTLNSQFIMVDRVLKHPDIVPPWIEFYLSQLAGEYLYA